MKKLVIFDLDGTLLNTIRDLGESCNYALEKLGFPTHPIHAYSSMVGNGIKNLLQKAHPDGDEKTIDKLLQIFVEHYNDHCTVNTYAYKGIPELLAELNTRGIKIAVASNKYQTATNLIINHFFSEIPFVSIEGHRDGRRPKPDPSIIFSILSKNPTPKSEVLMIGDSGVDMETAARAGIESIGVTWGFRTAAELKKSYADYIINTPSEILDHLNDLY